VRVSVAVAQSEDSPATANLARLLLVRVLANPEAEKSVDHLASIDLPPHRLPARAPVKCEAEEREGRVHTVNLAGSQEAERQLRLSRGRGSRSAERKKGRRLHRQDHNKSC
jgi:hypothetical protein